jgi:nitrile hydratase
MPTMFPAEGVPELVKTGGSTRRDVKVAPKFKPGDKVRAININPAAHTRLPRYVRGKVGTIVRDHGVFVFPDSSAAFQGEKPQHVYNVAFEAAELWGEAVTKDQVHIDLFEDYIVGAK